MKFTKGDIVIFSTHGGKRFGIVDRYKCNGEVISVSNHDKFPYKIKFEDQKSHSRYSEKEVELYSPIIEIW